MGDMADMISDYGYDDFDDFEAQPFKVKCAYCGKTITMTPVEDNRWMPFRYGRVHVCEARIESQRSAAFLLLSNLDES